MILVMSVEDKDEVSSEVVPPFGTALQVVEVVVGRQNYQDRIEEATETSVLTPSQIEILHRRRNSGLWRHVPRRRTRG